MRQPKKHHFVPRLLLRNFVDLDDSLWTYSKIASGAGVRRSKPEGVFAENELYTERTAEGGKDTSLEAAFGDIETAAAPVVRKLIEAARSLTKAGLSSEERAAWDRFYVTQTFRTPDFTSKDQFWEDYENALGDILSELETSHPVSKEVKDAVFAELNSKQGRHNTRVRALGAPRSPAVYELMAGARLVTVALRSDKRSFAIGSNPVIKLADHSALGNARHETWLPIAPDVCVCMVVDRGGEGIHNFDGDNDAIIRAINMATFQNSTAVCAKSELLLKSLAKAHHGL